MTDTVRSNEIEGRRIDLAGRGYVFVGTHPKYPDDLGLVFRNAHGELTSFRLSSEAVAALKELLVDPSAGVPGSPPPPDSDQKVVTLAQSR